MADMLLHHCEDAVWQLILARRAARQATPVDQEVLAAIEACMRDMDRLLVMQGSSIEGARKAALQRQRDIHLSMAVLQGLASARMETREAPPN